LWFYVEFLISNSKLNRFTLEFLVEKLSDQPWPWPHITSSWKYFLGFHLL